jgi:putative ABC transport system permease protein
MPALNRGDGFSTVTFRMKNPSQFVALKKELEADPRLQMQLQKESQFYADQSGLLTNLITFMGIFLTAIMAVGAVFGAMNTMYAAVAYRTREIGTLRALGFGRTRIVTAFLAESVALAIVGGVIGCALALPVHGLSTGAMNMASFTELAFKFRITPALLAGGMIFSALMGAVGGLLPALRAARIPVARALREI